MPSLDNSCCEVEKEPMVVGSLARGKEGIPGRLLGVLDET
jgi:hypothetical protein